MANLAGRTLSHYRLETKIGAGGMGEVYRAVDTRLDRLVAVKILPPDLLADGERRRRFTQEAKAASALNHPNIVIIYDVGSDSGIDLMVMEYVDGQTLENLIARRPMPIATLLKDAVQIADALTAAHAAGIVHRDLKPTNVMVTSQGLVKVLDFGLAKLAHHPEAAADDQTLTARNAGSPTERGTVIGTAAYMSPEQAQGGVVDARSDIFSFGAVLYEMATGRRAFHGSTTMSTIASVLRDDPPRASSVTGAPLPHDLEIVINRALKKDPSRRFQHMADLKVALEDLKEESDSGRLMMAVTELAPPKRRPRWIIPAAAALVIAVAAVAGWLMWGSASAAPTARASTRLTFDSGATVNPAVSPDGKLIAFVSDRTTPLPNLWIQQVDGGQAVQLTNYEAGANFPSFSPDGARIVYQGEGKDEGLYVIPTIGGDPKKVAPNGNRPRFSPDGSQIAYWTSDGAARRVFVVPATGGQPAKVSDSFESTGVANIAGLVWSPDGKSLVALGRPTSDAPAREVHDWYVLPIGGGDLLRTGASAALKAQKVLGETDFLGPPEQWASASILFSQRTGDAANIWRVPINAQTFKLSGPAEQLTFGTAAEASPSLSDDGKLVFAAVDLIADYWTLPIDADRGTVTGPRTRLMTNSASDNQDLSRDGKTLLFCSRRGGNSDIWSRDLASGRETSILATPAEEHLVAASADASTFVYGVRGATGQAVFLTSTSGTPPRKLCDECGHIDLSRDAARMLYIKEPDHQVYYLMDTASGHSTPMLSDATRAFGTSAFSPDGRWVVFSFNRQLWAAPVRDSKVEEKDWVRINARTATYQWVRFSPNGSYLYYASNEDDHICLYAQRLSAPMQVSGAPTAIAHNHEGNTFTHPHGMRVAADKIVLLMNQGSSNIWMTHVTR